MKRILLILAACACACAWAGVASARLGSLGRNDAVVTNVTDVTPGNYETVSNRAMTASNYTDAVAGTLRGKGDLTVYGYWPFIAYSYLDITLSPPVRMNYTTISYSGGGSGVGWLSESEINGSYVFILDSLLEVEYLAKSGNEYIAGSGDMISASADGKSITFLGTQAVDIRRESTGMDYPTNNRLATTNEISGKQDRLPYPTNAIPFSAIDGAPTPPSAFYDTAGGATTVSGATITYQAASNSVGSVALLAGTNVLHITAPSAITGHVRDFGLTVSTEDAATITLDSSVSWRFDAASTNLSAGSWNRIYCTESPTGVFSLQLWTPDSSQEATP